MRIAFVNRNTHSCCGLFNHTSCCPPLSSSTFSFLQYRWCLLTALFFPVLLIAIKYGLETLQSVAVTMWRTTPSVIWRGRCFVMVKVRIYFCNITHVLHQLHLDTQTCYYVTNFKHQIPSWKANGFSSGQEIPSIFCKLMVPCRFHSSTMVFPTLTQIKPGHTTLIFCLIIHLKIKFAFFIFSPCMFSTFIFSTNSCTFIKHV